MTDYREGRRMGDKAVNIVGIAAGVITLILALTVSGWHWYSVMGVSGGCLCLLAAPVIWARGVSQ